MHLTYLGLNLTRKRLPQSSYSVQLKTASAGCSFHVSAGLAGATRRSRWNQSKPGQGFGLTRIAGRAASFANDSRLGNKFKCLSRKQP